ncbi:MAG: succinyl-diaminopimelate desuccinylase, partial [Octadecabacter sp.]
DTPPDGAIILAITGDEEGPSTDGTIALLDWMQANHETMTACIVGEPTCPDIMGEMIKVGRRGSLTSHFTATGKQGHSAYPHRAKNPLPAMVRLLDRLASHEMDKGSDYFDPSTLAVVTIDTGNPATNVIPATCKASANVRFNDLHTSQSVIAWMQAEVDAVAADFNVKIDMATCVSGESFITPPGELSDLVSAAVRAETGIIPKPSTTGGTSDARFVKNHCPVVEVGLVGKTMHQVDECVPVGQITQLTAIYGRILRDYFS